ncbi:MAG: leucine-rich repeat domain-containing protein, partial [Mycoplasmataceae bacterium]|nr:leucine-rich repeat domain-containing protein [Mycoplasmataceae bacterium]
VLLSITLPSSIASIGNRAFENCVGLKAIDLSSASNITSHLGFDVFTNCTNLKTIDLSSTKIPYVNYSFEGCTALTNITFPDSLVFIGTCTFLNCTALTTIDLSKTKVTSISSYAFDGCMGLTTLKLSSAMFASDNKAYIASYAFHGCTKLNAIYIPDDAVSVPAGWDNYNTNAFSGCSENGIIYYSGSVANLAINFKDLFEGLSKWSIGS